MPLHYINRQFTPSGGTGMIEVHDPATEEVLDTVPRGTAQDAAAALSAAHAAFPTWRRTSANARAHLLHDAAAHMRQHQEQIVRLLTLEEGKPIPESDEEVEWLTTTFDYYAGLGVIQDISVR
jgi:betaine-aldehyde dehydrogenase